MGSNEDEIDDAFHNYQRVEITGEVKCGIRAKELYEDSIKLINALQIRHKYMTKSMQSFSKRVAYFLEDLKREELPVKDIEEYDNQYIKSHTQHNVKDNNNPFYDIAFPDSLQYKMKIQNGVMYVYASEEDLNHNKPIDFQYTNLQEFLDDQKTMFEIINDGPLMTFCYKKLQFLKSKFKIHVILNERLEKDTQRVVPHLDFYNIRKVDTHIHAASCMNQKHLCLFIRKMIEDHPDELVCKDKEGNPMSLRQVFESMNLTSYDISADLLDVHADRDTFQRFDNFNSKYNPMGDTKLREIFLKSDNYINGKYFARLLKEVSTSLEEGIYSNAEPRLSIYGRSKGEWDKLATWCVESKLYSNNIRWLIQVPRLYNIFKAGGSIQSFQQLLDNIFEPLFEVTNDPNSHPYLHRFLQFVTGIDSVDDESKPELIMFNEETPLPADWTTDDNPPYAYYIYYLYANLSVLNQFRKQRGFPILHLRPHCGEAGSPHHLMTAFMLCENISHGLKLNDSATLQYLYYLAQVAIAMSPLSNNSLFLDYQQNPLPEFLAIGLMISLSTDDPLQFHYTKEPLMEEYSIAAQVWKLSSISMCELARNSVIMSSWEHIVKQSWIGENYRIPGIRGNDINKTNVPDLRIQYRSETLLEELTTIFEAVKGSKPNIPE